MHPNEWIFFLTMEIAFADLLLYSLCPAPSLSVIYEQLLQLLCQDLKSVSQPTSVAAACVHLLTSLSDDSQVLEHRVRRVHRMVRKGKTPQASRRLCMLLNKYKSLKPEMVPWVRCFRIRPDQRLP